MREQKLVKAKYLLSLGEKLFIFSIKLPEILLFHLKKNFLKITYLPLNFVFLLPKTRFFTTLVDNNKLKFPWPCLRSLMTPAHESTAFTYKHLFHLKYGFSRYA